MQEGKSFSTGADSMPKFQLITPTPPSPQSSLLPYQEQNAEFTEEEVPVTNEKERKNDKDDDNTSKV